MNILARTSLLSLVGLGLYTGEAPASFTDVTAPPLNHPDGLGVAWCDYDGDGDPDIYLGTIDSADRLFRNDGGGAFTDVTSSPMGSLASAVGLAWADYDNDGRLDLYVVNNQRPNNLFHNLGGGSFADVASGPLGDWGGAGVAWGDYDNDGYVDIYMTFDGANRLFHNLGTGSFSEVATGPAADAGDGGPVAWADYDNDGDLDLYVANRLGNSKLLRNDGGDTFFDATTPALRGWGSTRGVAWGDYDNDGDLDLYLANWADPEVNLPANQLLRNDGGVFTDVSASPVNDGGDGAGVAWGDYDNDGDLDLYVVNSDGSNKYFVNNGSGAFIDASGYPLNDSSYGTGMACADYDEDGDLDIYLANLGANKLFRNDESGSNHWLHVDLVGTESNRAAIGARIRVDTGSLSQIREISGGSGRYSQNSLTAEFGLGWHATVDAISIRWPSGIVQETTGVAVDQRITIFERETSYCPGYSTIQVLGTFNGWDENAPSMYSVGPCLWEDVIYVWAGCEYLKFRTENAWDDPLDFGGCVPEDPTCQVSLSGDVCLTSGAGTALGLIYFPTTGIYRVNLDERNWTYEMVLDSPDYYSVQVVGDFNDWDPYVPRMTETTSGVWIDTVYVEAGCHRLKFLTDGYWDYPPDYGACVGEDPSCSTPMSGDVCLLEYDGPALGYINFPASGGYVFTLNVLDETYSITYPDQTGVEEGPAAPPRIALLGNHPNPFRIRTAITYQIPARAPVRLRIFNSAGQLIRTLEDSWKDPGTFTLWWNGQDAGGRPVGDGIYYYRLEAGTARYTKKALLIR
jgi:hypothetical protein